MSNPKSTHLSSIRHSHPEAFAAMVEILIEDCEDTFEVNDGGVFATHHVPEGDFLHRWNDETKQWDEAELDDSDEEEG